jgi:hypothetical protein
MPALLSLVEAKMGVREVSAQRKVQRFLTSLSEGLMRSVEVGEEQMSIKAAMAWAERACKSTLSSVYGGPRSLAEITGGEKGNSP